MKIIEIELDSVGPEKKLTNVYKGVLEGLDKDKEYTEEEIYSKDISKWLKEYVDKNDVFLIAYEDCNVLNIFDKVIASERNNNVINRWKPDGEDGKYYLFDKPCGITSAASRGINIFYSGEKTVLKVLIVGAYSMREVTQIMERIINLPVKATHIWLNERKELEEYEYSEYLTDLQTDRLNWKIRGYNLMACEKAADNHKEEIQIKIKRKQMNRGDFITLPQKLWLHYYFLVNFLVIELISEVQRLLLYCLLF